MKLACWNMRSLVESEGGRKTARSRSDRRDKGTVEKKSTLMVWELKRYGIFAAGISETQWFGNDIYDIEDHTILHSGRPLPGDGDHARRGEGVGLILSPEATRAWREGGEMWQAVSARVITARLPLKEDRSQHLSLISIYAPTFRASIEEKDDFFADLQKVLDSISDNDILVVMGDWNARVGSYQGGEQWSRVIGGHGLGRANEAGFDLLSFCEINNLAIMNTFFHKKDIHKQSWQHPGTKLWHCIDFVVMRQCQRERCFDVQVMRGATCWSDHRMVRAKVSVRMDRKLVGRKKERSKKLNIGPLRNEEVQLAFDKMLGEQLDQQWPSSTSAQEKWETLVSCIQTTSQEVLPTQGKATKNWFLEKESIIRPALEKCNQLLTRWLASQSDNDKRNFLRQKSAVQRLIRRIKNQWYQDRATEIEHSMKTNSNAWKSIRQLQRVGKGLQSICSKAARAENGDICRSQAECNDRWVRHFQSVLNIQSEFVSSAIEAARQRPVRAELDNPPTEDEVTDAVQALKSRKAAGKNGISPEVVKRVALGFGEHIMELFKEVWGSGKVPKDWADAIIIIISKKGNLSLCDNWRGISLLGRPSEKLFTRILQQRLQCLAEDELTESQCGFRKGRGCTDMIFCARQLIEKTLEHEDTLHLTFVDLRKAYDSVPRAALWRALEKCGVPPVMLSLIKSLHEGMSASLCIQGTTIESEVEVTNGLRQGCPIAPTLFNLFFNLVVESWREACAGQRNNSPV